MDHYFKVQKVPERRSKFSIFRKLVSNLSMINWLILMNVLFFILVALVSAFIDMNYLVLVPNNLFNNYYFWTLLTSMFMHAGFLHLLVNMISLFFVGGFLEMIIGKRRFLGVYVFSGIFAGLFYAILSFYFGNVAVVGNIFGDSALPAVGASGALFGLLGVLSVLVANKKISLLAGPMIAIILGFYLGNFVSPVISSFVSILIWIYVFFSMYAMFSFNPLHRKLILPITISAKYIWLIAIVPLILLDLIPGYDLPIGNMAHLGGFIAGVLYGVYLRIRYKKKTRAICEYFS